MDELLTKGCKIMQTHPELIGAPLASLPTPPPGMRAVRILTCDLAHGVPWWRKREFHVYYPAEKRFNIQPPQYCNMPRLIDTAIWGLRAREPSPADTHESMLTPDERRVAQVMESGWSFADMQQYHGDLLTAQQWQKTRPLRHAIWLMPLCDDVHLALHPTAPRLFTIEELCTALDLDEAPAANPREWIAQQTPRAVLYWVVEQSRLCEENAWSEVDGDWESRYDRKSAQWVGSDTHGAAWKTFDLSEYYSKERVEQQ